MAAQYIRITNLYDQTITGPQLDVVVTKTDTSTLTIPPGHSKTMAIADGITGIAAGTVNSGAAPTDHVDIG